jgi:hypothetical protein
MNLDASGPKKIAWREIAQVFAPEKHNLSLFARSDGRLRRLFIGRVLTDYIEFHGASGSTYRYLAPDDRTSIRMAGGYVLVGRADDGPALLYAGVTEDLAEGWRETLGAAQSQHGEVQVFIHRTVARQARDAEQADIIAAYDPPMNRMA